MKDFTKKLYAGLCVILTLYGIGQIVFIIVQNFIIESNLPIWYLISLIILVAFFMITIVILYNCRCKLVLFETLAKDRPAILMAIRMMLIGDEKKLSNTIRVDKAVLEVSVPDNDNNSVEQNIHDFRFSWKIHGENTRNKKMTRYYFKMAGDNPVSFGDIDYSAWQIINKGEINEKKLDIKYDDNSAFKKSNYYILPLELRKPVENKEFFSIEVEYIWPQCFNSNIDYLIVDPTKYTSHALEKFEIRVLADDKVINNKYNIRLFKLPKRKLFHTNDELIEVLEFDKTSGWFNSSVIDCKKDYVYYVEISKK